MHPNDWKVLQYVHPAIVERAKEAALRTEEAHGISIQFKEGLRSWEYQEKLYSMGRKKNEFGQWELVPGGRFVTKVKPGFSAHNFGLGLDICFRIVKDPYLDKHPKRKQIWTTWGRSVEEQGLTWGGDWDGDGDVTDQTFHDWPHAEGLFGLSMEDCRKLYAAGGLRFVWTEIDRLVGEEPGVRWQGMMGQLERYLSRV
jgi:hypothetical protein